MFLSCCLPKFSMVRSILPVTSSCTRAETHTPPGCAKPFEARGNVDAVAKDVAVFDDDVALMNADAPLDAVFRNRCRVGLGHLRLHSAGAPQRIDGAAEFD